MYGATYEVFKPELDRCTQFEAAVTYYHPAVQQEVTETTWIDLQDYLGTWPRESEVADAAEKLSRCVADLRSELRTLSEAIRPLTSIAGATGLQISAPSLRALARSFGVDPRLERLTPIGRSAAFFQELLGVDKSMARRLASHCRDPDSTGLSHIEGMTPELLDAKEALLDLRPA